MNIEIEHINKLLEQKVETCISGIIFTKGLLHDVEVVTAVSGVGKVFAAVCTQTIILHYTPSLIINIGVAGSLVESLKIGDIAIASSVVQYDMDPTAFGDPLGLIAGINIVNIPADTKLTEKIEQYAAKLGIKTKIGVIASGDQFLSDADKKQGIRQKFDAIACEMEGASIGQVCYINKVSFSVVRAISDEADDYSISDYSKFLKTAAQNSANVISMLIKDYKNENSRSVSNLNNRGF